VHLAVGGDVDALRKLRSLVRQGPLDRPEPFDWVPHVTLGQEIADDVIEAALVAFRAFRADVEFDAVDVLRQDEDRVWRSIASMPFAD
jgi:2'-5' RNA ligase